ncbi:AZOBR_p60025 family cell surface glycopolymer formation protein [Spirulina major]|uniref:AZOBR_p60025 family cell surface glycopolymer formation protein n=1 Tax=Spirulina major TaxID=270636 RepID=UPI000933BB5D|nr:hypothetical protein [Spirulina major]
MLLFKHPVWKYTIIAFFVALAIAIAVFIRFDHNITSFMRIGNVLPLSPYANPETTYQFDEFGYDGQLFFTIALDPFLQNPDSIAALDDPPFRYRRIFYPLLSYILGLGNAQLIPYMMVLINILSIPILVWVLGRYLETWQQQIWPALGVLSIPGLWIVLAFSTADGLNTVLMAIALYTYSIKKPQWSAVAIMLACLTRETSLLIWLTLMGVSVWDSRQADWRYFLPAIIPSVLWNGYVLTRFNSQTIPGTTTNFVAPFFGISAKIKSFFSLDFDLKNGFDGYMFGVLCLLILVSLIIAIIKLEVNKFVLLGTVGYGAVVVMSSMYILDYVFNYPRTFIDLYTLFFLLRGGQNLRICQGIMIGLLAVASSTFISVHLF